MKPIVNDEVNEVIPRLAINDPSVKLLHPNIYEATLLARARGFGVGDAQRHGETAKKKQSL
jgi:hypothetical protein